MNHHTGSGGGWPIKNPITMPLLSKAQKKQVEKIGKKGRKGREKSRGRKEGKEPF